MYNNGGAASSVVAGGTLAATGSTFLQTVGLAIIGICLCLGGLLAIRAHRLRSQRQAD